MTKHAQNDQWGGQRGRHAHATHLLPRIQVQDGDRDQVHGYQDEDGDGEEGAKKNSCGIKI